MIPFLPRIHRPGPLKPKMLMAGLMAGAGFFGCASAPSSTNQTNALDSHKTLRTEEYLLQAKQEPAPMPGKADALILAHPFASNQPAGRMRTLAQIYFRIRSAGSDLPQGWESKPDGTPYASAELIFKVSPGFNLVRLYGVPAVDSGNGMYKVRWDTLGLGEWRVVIAELEGYLEPSGQKERLMGGTLRTKRFFDGGVFEALEGTGMEWHRAGSPAKLNPWTARNSLYVANAEALKEAGRLAEAGEPALALALVDLQLQSLQALKDLDPDGMALEEKRILESRGAVAAKVGRAQPAPASLPADGNKDALRIRTAAAEQSAANAPQGIWSTLAQLLAVRLD